MKSRFSGIALEAVIVALLGGLFAGSANFLSPEGLELGRDYFPAAAVPLPGTPDTLPPEAKAGPHSVARHEFASVSLDQMLEITRDPRYVTRRILILDARNTEAYRDGHIPGALQFDPFRAEQNLASILPASLAAEQIAIYCNGGDCEDSQLAARLLRDLGIPPARLAIFDGGIKAWMAADHPVQSSP